MSANAKPRSLIRGRALALFAAFTFISLWIYYLFFFELALKYIIAERFAGIRGADVVIQSLSLSLYNSTFEVAGIEIARRSIADRNLLEIDKISGRFDLVSLTRKKIRLYECTIEGLRHNTPRSIPTRVATDLSNAQSDAAELAGELYTDLKKDIGDNPIQQLTRLTSGITVTDKLTLNESDLTSIQELKREREVVNELLKKWEPLAAGMMDLSSVEIVRNRWSKWAPKGRVLASHKNSPEVGGIIAEIDSLYQEIESTIKDFKNDTAPIESILNDVEQFVAQDVPALRQKVGFPDLNLSDLTPALMGQNVLDYFGRMLNALSLSRRYMPTGTAAIVQQERSRGVSIHYGRIDASPMFLVDKTTVYSKLGVAVGGGDVQGTIEGLTSDPPIYGRPLQVQLTAEFPTMKILGAQLDVRIDHTGKEPKESVAFSAKAFPIQNWVLNDTPLMKFIVSEASLSGNFSLELSNSQMTAKGTGTIGQAHFEIKSTISTLETQLQDSVGALLGFDVRADVTGTLDKPNVDVRSDLGSLVAKKVHDAFREEINLLDETIRRQLLQAVGPEVNQLETSYQQFQRRIWPAIERRQKVLQELKQQTDKLAKNS